MDNRPEQDKIKEMKFYIPEAFRFYNIKNEFITPLLFTAVLFIMFAGELITFKGEYSGILIRVSVYLRLAVSNMLFSLYLDAYLRDLKDEKYSISEIISFGCTNFRKILIFSIISLILFMVSALISVVLLIPAVFAYLIITFSSCYGLQEKNNILDAFKKGIHIVINHKNKLFGLIVKFIFPISVLFLLTLIVAGASDKTLIFPFVLCFSYIVSMLMLQRIVALLFYTFEIENQTDER